MHPEIEAATARLDAQTEEVEAFVRSLDEDSLNRRPEPEKWSVAEHVEHLTLSNRPYASLLGAAVEEGRERDVTHRGGGFKKSLIVRLLIWSLKPPVRWKMKTFGPLEPKEKRYEAASVLADFRESQEELAEVLRAGDGLDLGRIKVTSPFVSWLKFSVIQAVDFLASHGDRHLWLMRRSV